MPLIKSLAKTGVVIACAFALLVVGYIYRGIFAPISVPIVERLSSLVGIERPCYSPITYNIGVLDERFDLTKNEILADIGEAADIWDEIAGKELFEYREDGDLSINLIYDYRQKATADLQDLGMSIEEKAKSYDALKRKYDSLTSIYATKKDALTSTASAYMEDRKKYEEQIGYWEQQGGISKGQYSSLEEERVRLNALAEEIETNEDELNSLGTSINSTASTLNRLARELNLNVARYNTIGASTGGEFDEGEYIRDEDGTIINIYQYENKDKLVRVLAHELGHALGLEHVDDERAIMYRLNHSSSLFPTAADVSELRRACSIES